MKKFRIAVVGSGAIGCYYGAKLAAAHCDIHFLMRGNLSEVQRDGLFVKGEGENFYVRPLNCYSSTAEIGACDLVLIALKTTANDSLIELLPPLFHDRTMLLTLQNGLGNEEFLARHFGEDRVLGGLCFICVTRTSRTSVERADYGHINIGEWNRPPAARTHDIAAGFRAAGVDCSVVEDLSLERWRKLVWNIPFNGLSILAGGVDTAAILADDVLRQSAVALMQEVVTAANKCGLPLEQSAVAEQIHRTEAMGPYKPSTLLDFEAGKPLEIEAIWGEPFRQARAAGAETPRLEMVYSLLQHLDRSGRAAVPPFGRAVLPPNLTGLTSQGHHAK